MSDTERLLSDKNIRWEAFKNATILVTGATGLIGKNLIKILVLASEELKLNIRILAQVRNREKTEKCFNEEIKRNCNIDFLVSDICDLKYCEGTIDYIVHCASITDSYSFANRPLEVIKTNVNGTFNALEIARNCKCKHFVYLSTMEVYGCPTDDGLIGEDYTGGFDTLTTRNSYPLSKLTCENICMGYMKEHDVPVTILRLTQTFGPGVEYDDKRVFAEFARRAMEKKDIVLHTKGETKRSYLYTVDAIKAILLSLVNDNSLGKKYNVANEQSYCSIYEMAQMVAEDIAEGKIKVVIDEGDTSNRGYAPTLCMNLDTSLIRKELGWKWETSLVDMYRNMIEDMKDNRKNRVSKEA